jgi:hypothetical protein
MKTVYLYGPITGKTFAGCTDWRNWMIEELKPHGIAGISPLRFKDYLANLAEISGHGREYAEMSVLSTPDAVLARDKFDVHRVDMLAGNFLDADRVSIGSMMEQAWAHAAHKPVAAAVPATPNHPHDHMFFNRTVGFPVHSLEALRDVIIAVLS